MKKEIEAKKGSEYAVNCQKLIYSGKILSDESPINAYNIEENKFVVVMVTKSKAAAAAAATTSTTEATKSSQPTKATSDESKAKPASTSSDKKTEQESTTPKTTITTQSVSEPTPEQNTSELEDIIRNIMEMGYPRDQVENALRASFNNPGI